MCKRRLACCAGCGSMLSFSLCIAANGPTLSGQPGQPAPRAPNQGQDDAASGMSRGNSDASSHTANGVSRGGANMKAPYEPAVLYATAPAMSPQQPTAAQAYTPLPEKVTRCPRLAVKGSTHDPDTSIGAQQHCGGQQRQAAQRIASVQLATALTQGSPSCCSPLCCGCSACRAQRACSCAEAEPERSNTRVPRTG